MLILFWGDGTRGGYCYQCFVGALKPLSSGSFINPEDGSSRFFTNVIQQSPFPHIVITSEEQDQNDRTVEAQSVALREEVV
jgi:hypothetical protein